MATPAPRKYAVLVTPQWPTGWCALHAFTDYRCHSGCVQTRVESALAALALEQYFRVQYGQEWRVWRYGSPGQRRRLVGAA